MSVQDTYGPPPRDSTHIMKVNRMLLSKEQHVFLCIFNVAFNTAMNDRTATDHEE
jgi:hypothetical protein